MNDRSELDCVFSPAAIAVVGASRRRGSIGGEIFRNLRQADFQGVVYPVNREATVVQAGRAYATVLDIPDPVDMAVIAVPRPFVLEAVRECAQKGVKALIVISSGFKEAGGSHVDAEQELLDICREHNMRLVGPNCLGVMNTDTNVQMNATFGPTYPQKGRVAFSSQSGALGLSLIDHSASLGVGLSKFIAIGNRADVCTTDLIQYWARDPATEVILLYIESLAEPREFARIAREVAKQKPIVILKSGRTESGSRAAASHTGSLAGSDEFVDALCKKTGMIRVNTMEELFDMAMVLENQPLPKGNRVGILTNAGGPGILVADICEAYQMQVTGLDDTTAQSLRQMLPEQASVKNPVDLMGSASPEQYRIAVDAMLKDSHVDALIVVFVPPLSTAKAGDLAKGILAGTNKTNKPVICCFMGTHGIPEGLRSLHRGEIPSYAFPESAASALGRAYHYAQWRKKDMGRERVFSDFDMQTIEKICQNHHWLSSPQCFQLLDAARIPTPAWVFSQKPQALKDVTAKLSFPVVLKAESAKALHKSDVGGVILNIASPQALVDAAQLMQQNLQQAGIAADDIDGYFVQEMVGGGEEVILGCKRHDQFGHLLMFGMGGRAVELWKDVAFRLHPITDIEAQEMINEPKGSRILRGYRGQPACDEQTLQDIILRLNYLLTLVPQIQECDLNPIKVLANGKGASVVDARFLLNPDTKRCQ